MAEPGSPSAGQDTTMYLYKVLKREFVDAELALTIGRALIRKDTDLPEAAWQAVTVSDLGDRWRVTGGPASEAIRGDRPPGPPGPRDMVVGPLEIEIMKFDGQIVRYTRPLIVPSGPPPAPPE